MQTAKIISDFLNDKAILRLSASQDNSSILDLLEDYINENSFSKVLSYFLDSNETHGLKDYFLKKLLTATKIAFTPHERIDSSTIFSWKTRDNNFIDILIVIRNKSGLGAPKGVIALENKVTALERKDQIADYQRALKESFPNSERHLIFLTPQGRAAKTINNQLSQSCQVREVSYSQVADISRCAVSRASNADARFLLKAFPRYIAKSILESSETGEAMKDLIFKVANSPKKRKALDLIASNIFLPNIRNLVYEYLIEALQDDCPGAYVGWHYPRKTPSPNEFNIAFQDLGREDFWVYYQLHRREENAPFAIRIMAWCSRDGSGLSRKYVQYAERLKGTVRLPRTVGEEKEWNNWKCIWAGPECAISQNEIRKVESEQLKQTLVSIIKRTRKPIAKYLSKHRIA